MISVDQIDALLPQTQCGKCGFKSCHSYAQAILNGENINRCPTGGSQGISQLASLLSRPVLPLNEQCGIHKLYSTAVINPRLCIGCKLCVEICPTDAIVGTKKHLHMVDFDLCSGCELCLQACPIDCISMVCAGYERTKDMAIKFRLLYIEKSNRNALLKANLEKQLASQSSREVKKAFLTSLMKELK